MRLTDVGRSVALQSKSGNILADKVGRFIGPPTKVRVACVAAAPGIRLTILLGQTTVMDDQEVSGVNRYPILPDDLTTEFGAEADELQMFLRNTTGAAILVTTIVDLDPL